MQKIPFLFLCFSLTTSCATTTPTPFEAYVDPVNEVGDFFFTLRVENPDVEEKTLLKDIANHMHVPVPKALEAYSTVQSISDKEAAKYAWKAQVTSFVYDDEEGAASLTHANRCYMTCGGRCVMACTACTDEGGGRCYITVYY